MQRPLLKPVTLIITLFYLLSVNTVIAAPRSKVQSKTTLQQLIQSAINNNAELKVKKLAWESMIEQYPQAVALNDPKLKYTEALDPIETRLGPQNRVLSLSQGFPYPGKLSLKGKLVKKDITIAKTRYDKASRDLVVSLKQSFFELAYLETAVRLSMQNKAVLEKITHIATTDYAASSSTLNDVAKAQSQYAQVSYDVLLLEELVSTEKTRINSLLNRNPEQGFEINPYTKVPVKLSHPITRLYQFAASNEELKIADLTIEKSSIKRDLAGYSSLPDFNVGVTYAQIGERDDITGLERNGDDGLAISIGLNIPLNHTKNKAIKHQAYLERQKNIENKKMILNGLNNKVKSVYFKINNAYRQAILYHKNLIPQAQRAKHIAEIQYRENKGSITHYLETQSTWLNFQLAYQRAVADYWKNKAEMEKLTGKAL